MLRQLNGKHKAYWRGRVPFEKLYQYFSKEGLRYPERTSFEREVMAEVGLVDEDESTSSYVSDWWRERAFEPPD